MQTQQQQRTVKQAAISVENRTLTLSFPDLAKFPTAPLHLNEGFFNNLKLNMRPIDPRYEVKREKIKRILISLSLFNLGNGSNITLTSTVCEVTILALTMLTANIQEHLNLHYPQKLSQSGSVPEISKCRIPCLTLTLFTQRTFILRQANEEITLCTNFNYLKNLLSKLMDSP